MRAENLKPKDIRTFTSADTIYIKTRQIGDNLRLCQFIRFDGRNVHGKVIGKEIYESDEVSAPITSCSLYGENPVSGRKHHHWFKPSGYAIYPSDYEMKPENTAIISDHPSFGMIGISRSSSNGTTLFGSSIIHNELITLRISRGKVERDLSREWFHAQDEIISVDMSASQFAEFITTPNTSGVPCTIRYLNRERVEEPPYESIKDRHSDEFKNKMDNLSSGSKNIIEMIKSILSKDRLNKADREEIVDMLNQFAQEIGSNIPFMEKSFSEQMDNTIKEAKAEIEAYVNRSITEAGRKALFGDNGDVKYLK